MFKVMFMLIVLFTVTWCRARRTNFARKGYIDDYQQSSSALYQQNNYLADPK